VSKTDGSVGSIPEAAFDMYGVEFHDRLSFLKAGLFYAVQVSTGSARCSGSVLSLAFRTTHQHAP
jgi:glycogen synthase